MCKQLHTLYCAVLGQAVWVAVFPRKCGNLKSMPKKAERAKEWNMWQGQLHAQVPLVKG